MTLADTQTVDVGLHRLMMRRLRAQLILFGLLACAGGLVVLLVLIARGSIPESLIAVLAVLAAAYALVMSALLIRDGYRGLVGP